FGLCIMTNLIDHYSTLKTGKHIESIKWASPMVNALDSTVSRLDAKLSEMITTIASLKEGYKLGEEIGSLRDELQKASIEHQDLRRLVESREVALDEKISVLLCTNEKAVFEKNQVVSELTKLTTEAGMVQEELARAAVKRAEFKDEILRSVVSLKE